MNNTTDSKKEREAEKILTQQLEAYELAYLKQRAIINHIRRIFIYELGSDKWDRLINSPDIDQDFEQLKEKPISISDLLV